MGPSGSRALFIAVDTKGHLRMKVKIPRNWQLWNSRPQAGWWHFHPKPSRLRSMVLQKMLLICSPLLPFKDFSTASLKVDINHISGSLSFRHCTLPLEISRQGVSKQAWFFHLLLLIQEFFYSTFKRAHDPSASSPTLSNAALRSSLPFIPHCAGQQTSFTAPKS